MPQFLNFAQGLSRVLSVVPESQMHPHHPDERAELFHSAEPGAAELEVLNFLNALVYLFKPSVLLETGTGSGLTTFALASAMMANGFGHLSTLEWDQGVSERAKESLGKMDAAVLPQIGFHVADSRQWIAGYSGPPFDFVFFDSMLSTRKMELELLIERGLLLEGAVGVFHGTSRLRGTCYHEFDQEFIETLDRASSGRQWLEASLSRGLRLIGFG